MTKPSVFCVYGLVFLSMMYRLMYGVWCISWCMVYKLVYGVWCTDWCMVYRLGYGVQAGVWCTG